MESVAALRDLSAQQVFASWLKGQSQRYREVGGWFVKSAATSTSSAATSHPLELIAIGSVTDGPNVAHVLYRGPTQSEAEMLANNAALLPEEFRLAQDLHGRLYPSVATCRRQSDGTWRLLAGFEFTRIGF